MHALRFSYQSASWVLQYPGHVCTLRRCEGAGVKLSARRGNVSSGASAFRARAHRKGAEAQSEEAVTPPLLFSLLYFLWVSLRGLFARSWSSFLPGSRTCWPDQPIRWAHHPRATQPPPPPSIFQANPQPGGSPGGGAHGYMVYWPFEWPMEAGSLERGHRGDAVGDKHNSNDLNLRITFLGQGVSQATYSKKIFVYTCILISMTFYFNLPYVKLWLQFQTFKKC